MIQLQDPAQSLLSTGFEEHPLSWGQRALWMAERLAPGEAPYNLAAAGWVLGGLDIATLRRAWALLTARHPALRTTFHETAPGEPVQRVHAAMAPDVSEVDVSRGDLRQRLAEEAWRPFDLETGPPLRVRLFTGMPDGAVLLVAVHHLAADLASLSILGQELGALLKDEAAELPPVPAGPAEWARRQERFADERRWAYWREHLAGELPVLALPTDRPRPPILTHRGDSRVLRLGPETLDALRAASRAEGATLWAALLASVGAWLHRITGQEDLLLGSPVSLRGGGPFAAAVGYFVELTVLREDLSGRPSFEELLRRSRREAFSALRHAGYPFALLAERLAAARDPSRHPIVQVLLALQGAGLAAFALAEEGDRTPLGDLELEGVAIPERRLPFDLSLLAAEAERGLAISCQFNAALFDGATVERLLAAFETLLSEMTADPGRPVADLPLLGEAERAQILRSWSGAGVEISGGEACLHELVFAQALRTPEATAVVHGTERTTYEELAHRAGELAATLREMGVAPESRVGVLVDRGPEMVVSVLGVLAAGGAYVPLDPVHPEERRRMILEDAGISALIARSGIESRGLGGIPGRPSPGNLAYVLYTSGSTGRPKGVAVTHRSAVARVRWAGEAYAPEELAGVLAATSLGFDLSVFELFVPLSHGGAVILVDDALALPNLPARGEVTLVNTVPSAMAELLRAGSVPASVRVVNLAGEALPEALAVEVHRQLPRARLWNLYGPTEDTVYSTFAPVRPGEEVSIGRPLSGTRVYVLDREMQPLPAGVPGELLLGGSGQARGYLGRPDLTAARFVPDPFSDSGGRLYRTGDLVRFRAAGELDFLGRIDHQVKVRGFRVELGEIEVALARHPGVEAAAVILREDRLVAYVVGAASSDDLRTWLRASLPSPMIPSAFVLLDRLPLTPNGKIDRRALPAPVEAVPEEAGPATPTEEILAGVVADVLGVTHVGVRDSFFDLGGHSLLAARVVSRVREALGVELPMRALFEEPTVAGLARRIAEAEAPDAPPLVPRPRPRPIPLSFAQERLWFLWSLAPESPFYNMPAALRLAGPLSIPALAGTFEEIVRRQEALRTRFPLVAGGPVQAIDPPSPVPLPVVDLEGLPETAREAERLSLEEARRPFDLATGPVLRTTLLRLGHDEHLLLVTMHHAVSDGWSIAVLHRDFADLYSALAAGRPLPLAPLPVQYADFTLWQRERPLGRELAWWRERLADLPPGDLPSDRPRPAAQTFRGATLRGRIPAELAADLRALSRRLGVTLFMALHAGFEAVVHRWTGRDDAVTGSPVSGRDRLELDRLVGFFVNTLVLRTDLSGRPGFAGLARRVRETALGAWAHQALPFERLVEELAPERDLAFQPLFQRMFQLLEMPPERIGLGDLAVERAETEQGAATFDLALDLVDDPSGLIVKAVYATDLFDGATIQRLLDHLNRLLEGAVADPERPVAELPLLLPEERHQLLSWSGRPEEPEETPLAHLSEVSEAVALVAGERTVSYGELARDVDRLARRLAARGVGPEVRVGVLLERSPELVTALLAVLAAGGTYVPLDPALPQERLDFLIEDAGVAVLLAAGAPILEDGPEAPLPPAVPGEALAYVIYTSGSTGQPKGVGVSRRALAAHIRAVVRAYELTPADRVLAFASPSFDVSLEQILPALAAGAALVLRSGEVWDPADLPRRFADLGVTVADLPTAYWHQLAAELEGLEIPAARPRLVLAGGEAMAAGPLRRWRSGPWSGVRLLNAYGPTEATITASVADLTGRITVGRPFAGRTLHVLDREGDLAPPGLPGELAIGGPLLARGYLGRPDLTAFRFVPDPWGAPGGRLYRTGDRARFLADGEVEFLGRIDAQVKLRGYRIEPGEVEAALAGHPAVRQAVVVGREDRLLAYVTADLPEDLEAEQVGEWREVYDEDVYAELPDPTFNVTGWTSSYTRGPIPEGEMREWLEGTVARLQALAPRRVLEIGCGTGLLLFRIAPHTERYLGTDFSESALGHVRSVLDERGWPAGTELRRALADDASALGDERFDAVILNSVVQYFPSLTYLERVLDAAVSRVEPGGFLFVGDVRSLPLLSAFHASVERFRGVASPVEVDPELVIHPAFFSALAQRLSRLTHVEVQLRRGRVHNELTRFRYDAVLHVEREAPPEPDWLDWEGLTLAALRGLLGTGPDLMAVRGIPNARLRDGIDPEAVWAVGEEHGYATGLTWSADPGRFDAVFRKSPGLLPGLAPKEAAGRLANDPLRRKAVARLVPALRAWATERLPAWMVPSDVIVLDALPLTSRGKVDLRALPAPEGERPELADGFVPPKTPEERTLASLWGDLLGVARVGLHDNFFALGGHSLLATQVVSRVRQAFAVDLPLRHLFEAPTVAGLAARLRAALATAGKLPLPPVEPVPREGDLTLSFGQQRLWFLHRMNPDAPGYLMAGAFRLTGTLSVPALASALSEVVRRHEVLRSTYHEGPVQRIHPPHPLFLPVVDLSGLADGGEEIRRLVRNEAGRPFDLERDLMVRGTLLRLGEREHVALLTLHHIASDGWSVDVLVRELAVLYGAAPLPDLLLQYGDFAVWQRRWLDGLVLEGQLAWWKERLAGAPPVLELPTDRPRPPVRTPRGGRRPFAVPPDLAAALQDLATREGTTLFVLLLAAWQALLGRITHQEDLVVGTPVAGRRQAETEDLIGFFVNTLVLRADLAEDAPFRDFLARVHNGALDAFAHQDLPFERLVEELNPGRSLSYTPLFQVTFALQHASRVPLELPGLTLRQLPFEPEAKFDLELALAETEDGLAGTLDYAADLFDPATAERLAGLYGNLLGEIAAAPGRRLSDLEILSETARRQILEWNVGAGLVPAPVEATVLDLFDAQVERTPDATAVVAGDVALTYRELAQRSDDVARRLLDRIHPGDVVGLRVERNADLAIGLLGIWKAGAVFLPLDPSYPEDRLDFMIQDAGTRLVLTQIPTAPGPPSPGGGRKGDGRGGQGVRIRATALAYLIYTSGTTGTPKAVMVEHGSLLHTLRATAAVFGFEAGEWMPSIAPFSFDIFLFEVLSPLLVGGTVAILPSADSLLEELPRVTRFHAVPAVLRQVVERAGPPERYAGLREIYTGGDAVPADLLEAARAAFPSARLRVLYGPTEGTIVCSFHRVGTEARSLLGRPFPGVSLRLLDPWGNPVPVGVPGEIYVGGPGVARGYLGRPELTAERFVPAPGGARLYRTGDLARFRPDGALEFLGRADAQVKVRGVRIEPGEVEARLSAHPGVRQAAVVAREEPGGRILAAFYVPEGEALEEGELKPFLAQSLQESMIPSRFVPLQALPLTANAKVDRGALARMELSTPEASAAPRTPTEEILAGLFAEVLGTERVGVRDDFFALGGHSLLATRLVSRVREALGVELPLPALFEEPTVAGLAGRIGAFSGAVLPPVRPVPRGGDLPLSFAQQRLWFLDQMEPGTPLYNMPALRRLIGPLDVAALAAAFAEVVRRHEALRATFPARRGAPRQEIHPFLPIPLPVIDLLGLPEEARRLEIEETRRPFDLAAGPLLRALLLRIAPEEHVLAVTMHHIVSDGWSVGVLVRELAALYAGEPLPPLPVQYADFAVWQREWFAGGVLDAQLSWWRERLAGVPFVLEVPADRPRPPVRSPRGAEVVFEVEAAGLVALGRQSGATFFMTLLAGFQALLLRITGQDDFLIGTPVAGRRRPEIEGLIGFFVNTLPLRADLSGRPTVRALLSRVREDALGAWAHQDLPFERLVEELDPVRDPSRTPLVQVLFALQDLPLGAAEVPGLAIEPLAVPSDTAKMDLTVTLTPRPDGSLAGSIEFAVDLFDGATVERLAERFGRLLAGMAEDPERTIDALPLLSETERSQMLLWGSGAAVEGTGTIHGLFEEQAERTPDLPAVSWDGGRLTYAELRRRARRLAARLGALEPETRVAVLSDRSPDFVTALLAILYTGGVYVPLDPEYPAERRAFLLRDSGSRILLTGRDLQPEGDELPDAGFTPARVSPDGLAYVLYTSGSTGQPKGVEVTHRAVVRLAKGADYVRLGPGETVAQASSVSFDAATFEIWGALLNGAELSVLPAGPTSLEELGLLVEQRGITTLWLTAGLFHQMVDGPVHRLAGVRTLLAGGETVSAPHVRRLLETLPGVAFVNGYGPTENTTFTCCHRVEAAEQVSAPLPLGQPITGTRVVLLDRDLRLVPPGVPGELCAGGDGLARGYLGRPDLTAATFVPDPEGVGERLYRTGDLARWRPDGTLEFLGRHDHQVKLRGFRIELGEIEAVLASHPAVGQAIVLVREDRPGDRRLVAFVEGTGDAAGLRAFLKDRLPGFMVPSAFVWLDALPLTGNGKVDRRALAALPLGPEAREGAVPPRTPVEEGLAAIWSEVLGAGVLSREDDFFELGGHSLLATQVASRLREAFAVELPLRDLFAFPRLADLAAHVEEERRAGAGLAAPPVVPVPRPPEGLPLSFAQEWMWVVDQLDPEGAAYNAPIPVSLAGELDLGALQAALRETAARHEILRTVFTPGPLQRVRAEAEVPFTLVDLSALPADRREAEAVRQAIEEARRPFDLASAPPIRALLLRLSPAEHRLVLDLHHIVTDGWSAGVLLREIAALYTGEGPAPLPVQYGDFAVWQRDWLFGETLDRLLDHWRERLAGPLPALELPIDRPRTATTGALGERLPFALTLEETDAFRALARQRGATLFAALLSGFETLLHRIAHQDDLLVGTPVAGRTRREVEDLVGYFVNNLVLRTDLGGDPPFTELVDRVQETALDAWSYQDLPLLTLVQALHPERARPGAMPLFQAWFQLQNTPLPAIDLPGLALSPWEIETPAATFDLELLTMEAEDGLRGHLVVNRDLFRRETAERMLGWLLTLLRGAAAVPESRLSELPLLSGEELAQILAEAGPAAAFPEVLPLHRAFEARAAEAPDAPAVTFEEETLSYEELDRRANRLAWHLRSLGVGPEVRVGLAFPRSLDLVVAILGILKAGGAYVPLDPDYPRERLDFLAADAGLRVVLTPEDLPETGPETPPEVDVVPDALAYVIYTSGSTGQPKGVMVTHRQAARLFAASAFFGFGPGDVWTLFHSYAFDFSVWEIWGALLHGGRLVVVPRWVARSPQAFRDLLAREGVTVLNQTPSAFYQLLQVEGGDLRLRWVIFGGEALEPAKLRPWFDRHGDERPVLVNMFGITETTVHVTFRPLTRADAEAGSVIGAPLPDLSLHLLDRALRPVPPGVVGEIFVGGAGVTRGYHGRPDLTAERFLPDELGARLYRSGDLARRRADGEIEYLCRADQQLKVRGFRIEPGEIESALVRHPAVGEAAVLARRVSAEDVRLVAFLAPRAGREIPMAEELRGFLLETLPEHMVPASFIPLPALPLTAHGKVDRRALEDLGETAEAPRAAVDAPANPLEERLAALWAELLEVDSVGRDESFFALGGHSLLMTRVATRVREELGVVIPIKSFFDRPTVAGLAEAIRANPHPLSPSPISRPSTPGEGGPLQAALPALGHTAQRRSSSPGGGWKGDGRGGQGVRIQTLAFPTANRPDILARGLESYAATAPHRRFLVLDDSKDPAVREEYRRRLRDLQERLGVTILYAGLEEKRRFAADLAAEAGVDLAVTEAALLDPLGIGLTVGANRNAVLLATVGEGVLSVDDDTTSRAAPSPDQEEGTDLFSGTVPGTAFLSGRDPGEIRAFASREEALASLDLRPADLAGLHEGTLGQPVLVTTNGWAGDCGWHSPSFYMLLQGESLRRLTRTAEGYRTATASKEIVRSVPRTTLGDGDSFMATLFTGLDNRRLLPPFPPVLWGEDLLFGITLQLCFREARVGHLPWVAAHEPVEVRRFWPGEMARSASGVDHSRLVSALLDGFTPDSGDEPADALRRLGQYLLALGQMAPADFDALALRSVRSRAAAFAAELEARLASFDLDGEGAALWVADIRRYLDVLRKQAAEPDFGVPLDLLYGRDAGEARRLSQRLITNHGLVLFHWPELVEAARRLKERGRGLAEEVRGVAAVSFGQERLWLQDRLAPGSAAYNTANALRLSGSLDVPLLARCFAEIARRHEVLRSTFAERGGAPVQVVHPPVPLELPVVDLSALPEDARAVERARLTDEEFLLPFDLVRGPLSRVRLVWLGTDEHVLLLTLHHIISDAWSMGVITGELAALHAAFAAGRPSPLPPLPVQYADYARRQREWMAGPDLAEQLAWWRERLAGSRALEVPTDRPRPAVRRFRGGMRTVRLPVPLAQAVRALCREREVTLFMALLAAFEVLLHARTEETDLAVGVDVAGRTLPETEGLVGFFINQLVLRVDLGSDPTFFEILDRVRETAVSAFARQDLPFGRLVEELAPKRSLSRNPLFQVMFGLYNVPEADLDLGGITVSPVDFEGGAAVFDLSLYMAEAGDGLLGMLRYDADLFEVATVDRLLKDYETLLRRAVEAPGERVSALLAHLAAEKRSQIEAGRESLAQTRLKTLKTVRRRTVDDPKENP